MSKEGFVYLPTLEEDITVVNDNAENDTEIVFQDDKFKLYHALNENGLLWLSMDTKWMGGYASWQHKRVEYNQIDIEDNHYLKNPELCYVLVPADYKPGLNKNKAIGKKFLIYKGYGECYVPSGASYPAATVIYNSGDKDLWRFFITNKFPFITNNLEKKVGAELIKDKTELIYPDDFEGDDKGQLSWSARRESDITKVTIRPGTTEIKSRAFEGLNKVEYVEIPDSVTKVGSNLFCGCNNLKRVKLSANLTAISNGMFKNCAIEEIEIPDSVTRIGKEAFESWSYCNLTEVVIPSKVTKIGDGAFAYQQNLSKIVLPEGLKELGNRVFSGCESLKHIRLPDTLQSIGDWCFGESGLQSIFIPKSVTTIGRDFVNNTSVSVIKFEATELPANCHEKYNTIHSEYHYAGRYGGMGHYEYSYAQSEFGAKRGVNEDLELSPIPAPRPVFTDDNWEVYVCQTRGQLSELCRDKVWFDWDNWDAVERDELSPYNGMSTDFVIFHNKQHDTSFIYNPTRWNCLNTQGHGYYGFLFDESGSFYQPEQHGSHRFYSSGAQILERFLLDMGDIKLQKWAINKYKTGLDDLNTYLKINDFMDQIDHTVVYGSEVYEMMCRSTTFFYYARCGMDIGGETKFFKVNIVFPRNLRRLPNEAFRRWNCIESITLPNTLLYIGEAAFDYCDNLKEVILPPHLEEIGEYAFNYCKKLNEITIPASVHTIGDFAFGRFTTHIKCEAASQPEDWNVNWCSEETLVDWSGKDSFDEDINMTERSTVTYLTDEQKQKFMDFIYPRLGDRCKEIAMAHKDDRWGLDLVYHPDMAEYDDHPYVILFGNDAYRMDWNSVKNTCTILGIEVPKKVERTESE